MLISPYIVTLFNLYEFSALDLQFIFKILRLNVKCFFKFNRGLIEVSKFEHVNLRFIKIDFEFLLIFHRSNFVDLRL